MERRRVLPVLTVFTLLFVAGCIQQPGTDLETPENTLRTTAVECTAAAHPCTEEVRRGEPVRIRWNVEYNDEQPVTIPVNNFERGELGFGLLENFCTVFNPDTSTFTATKISAFGREDVSDNERVTLQGQETLRLEWEFHLRQEEISDLGARCTPSFRIEYTHTVNGSKQIQVRENEQVPRVQQLTTNLESPTPVKPRISANEVYQVDDPIYTEAYLENTGSGELVHVSNLNASITEGAGAGRLHPGKPVCGLQNPANQDENIIVISSGPRTGQTSRLECGPSHGFTVSQDELGNQQSNTYQLTMTGTYTYRQTVGTTPVRVAPSEGRRDGTGGNGGEEGDSGQQATIFVTSGEGTGNLSLAGVNRMWEGVSGANFSCTSAADVGEAITVEEQGFSFAAILSDSAESAKQRLENTEVCRNGYPLYNTNGEKVAESCDALWSGSIQNPVNFDEDGNEITGDSQDRLVWTGTDSSGGARPLTASYCNDWTTEEDESNGEDHLAAFGRSDKTDDMWLSTGSNTCSAENRIYCLQISN